MDEESFEEGFLFAWYVLNTMKPSVSLDAMAARLEEIADGHLTIRPSPPDAIAGIEAESGKPLPESLRASVHRMLANHAEDQRHDRQTAAMMLRRMGFS